MMNRGSIATLLGIICVLSFPAPVLAAKHRSFESIADSPNPHTLYEAAEDDLLAKTVPIQPTEQAITTFQESTLAAYERLTPVQRQRLWERHLTSSAKTDAMKKAFTMYKCFWCQEIHARNAILGEFVTSQPKVLNDAADFYLSVGHQSMLQTALVEQQAAKQIARKAAAKGIGRQFMKFVPWTIGGLILFYDVQNAAEAAAREPVFPIQPNEDRHYGNDVVGRLNFMADQNKFRTLAKKTSSDTMMKLLYEWASPSNVVIGTIFVPVFGFIGRVILGIIGCLLAPFFRAREPEANTSKVSESDADCTTRTDLSPPLPDSQSN